MGVNHLLTPECKSERARITRELFISTGAWGLWTGIDIRSCDGELIRDRDHIHRYVEELCSLIEMTRYGDPIIIHFGEDAKVAGFSMTQLIETSLISGHFANLTNTSYIDVFSCKYYDPDIVANFSLEFFKGEEYNLNVVLRK